MSNMADELKGRILINGKPYEMPSDFKIGELRILERLTGTELNDVNWESAGAFAALALIMLRREDPGYDEADLDDVLLEFVPDPAEQEGQEEPDSPPADAAAA